MISGIIRIILGLVFAFSGIVKAIDPMGTAYKVEEYLISMDLDFLIIFSKLFSVLLCASELYIGIMLIAGLWRRFIAIASLVFISAFSLITLWILISPTASINDCGCFGDIIHLTNFETFIKNIIFLVLILLYIFNMYDYISLDKINGSYYKENHKFYNPYQYRLDLPKVKKDRTKRNIIYAVYFQLCLIIPIYSLLYLPPLDFMDFNIGTDIKSGIEVPEGVDHGHVETYLIYENIQTGEHKEFTVDQTEWHNEDIWQYIDTKTVTVRKGYELKIQPFAIIDENGDDCLYPVLDKKGYTFVVVARDIKDLNSSDYDKLKGIYNLHRAKISNMIFFTCTPIKYAKDVVVKNLGDYVDLYNVDDVTLKSLIRSNKGVVLLNKGVVKAKWTFRSDAFKYMDHYDSIYFIVKWNNISNNLYWLFLIMIFLLMYLITKRYKSILYFKE